MCDSFPGARGKISSSFSASANSIKLCLLKRLNAVDKKNQDTKLLLSSSASQPDGFWSFFHDGKMHGIQSELPLPGFTNVSEGCGVVIGYRSAIIETRLNMELQLKLWLQVILWLCYEQLLQGKLNLKLS